ncbi:MAG: TlyA family RNA methyltransferase [Clostridiales bacterium]|nr:TlyA family RNA methyltransferase [Clostridiales bacterium]
MKKRRADELLYEQLALPSLELARALIMEGRVMRGDTKVLGPGEMLAADAALRVKGEIDHYVSRGAHKLRRALERFSIDLAHRTCIDVGASTGGFTDVMLRAGADRVYAVDVGYNLLDYTLRRDERVVVMERVNARFLDPEDFAEKPAFGATDVSFISLKAVLPAVFRVMQLDGRFVALVKPQFEAPAEDVGEKGVVRDARVHKRVLEDITGYVPETGWRLIGLDYSPIRGPEGNIEFLMDMAGPENHRTGMPVSIDEVLAQAYDNFFKSNKNACK